MTTDKNESTVSVERMLEIVTMVRASVRDILHLDQVPGLGSLPPDELRIALEEIEAIRGLLSRDGTGPLSEALNANTMVQSAMKMLIMSADQSLAPNYVAMNFVGLHLPFDRAEMVLVRPGGKTTREVAEHNKRTALRALHALRIAPADNEGAKALREKWVAQEIESLI